jgi:penicillin-binding protein 2
MFRSKRPLSSLFRLQQDGRFGDLGKDTSDADLGQFVASANTSSLYTRGSVPYGTSIHSRRVRFLLMFVLSIGTLFIARSAHLQVIRGAHYQELSSENRERIELIIPSRGLVLDRNGIHLAWNEPAFVLTMTHADLPDGDDRVKLFEHVAALIGVQPTDLDLLISQYGSRLYDPIPIADDLPYESAIRLAIEVSNLPGFSLTTRTKRIYDSRSPSLSHVIGYTGGLSVEDVEEYSEDGYRLIDEIGKVGVERVQEALLRGIPGRLVYEVDALGDRLSILSRDEAVLGSSLTLSIDAEFQKYVEAKLMETFDRTGASRGSVIALDPRTGAVRAMVSLPTYDANEFTSGISFERYNSFLANEDQPLFFRAVSGEFPSGSTFKPVVAYAALAEGIVSEHTSFLSTGGLRIGQWFFPDWKAGGHGVTDARKAISESVNTYFYIIGGGFDTITGLGVERISYYARLFGFGEPTGIDLPNEADGFLPSKEWKQEVKGERWYVGDTYHLAIGQGDFLTTPLQMAVAISAIANGGSRVTPYVVESADGFGADLLSHSDPEEIEGLDVLALSIVREGMRQTIATGSARSLLSLSHAVAGKTGTAQTPGDRPYHSWFTGFAPYSDPNLTLVVLVEEGGESNDAAVPLAREVFNWWFMYGDGE